MSCECSGKDWRGLEISVNVWIGLFRIDLVYLNSYSLNKVELVRLG